MTARGRAWAFLAAAITSEIIATVLLDSTEQFTRPALSLLVIAGYITSFACMAQALRTLPVSLTYALWSGIGTAVVAVIGVLLLGEELSIAKVAGLVSIVAGVVVLNLSGDAHGTAADITGGTAADITGGTAAASPQSVPPGDELLDEPARRDPA